MKDINKINEVSREKTNSIINCEEVINNRDKIKDTYIVSNLNIRYSNFDNVINALKSFKNCNIVSIGNDITTAQSNSILREMLYKINSLLTKNQVKLYINPLIDANDNLYYSCISLSNLEEIMTNLGSIKLLPKYKDEVFKYSKFNVLVLNKTIDYNILNIFNKHYNETRKQQEEIVLLSNQELFLTADRYKNKERNNARSLVLSQLYNFKAFKSVITPSVKDEECFQQNGRIIKVSDSENYLNFFKLNLNTLQFDNCIQIKNRG